MLVLHGALGLFDEVGFVVAALAGVLSILAFGVHIVQARRSAHVAEPVKIER